MNREYDNIGFIFKYKGHEYHRGDFSRALERGGFKIKFEDGGEHTLWIHENDREMCSLSYGTKADIIDLMMQILKDQQRLEKLRTLVKQMNQELEQLLSVETKST